MASWRLAALACLLLSPLAAGHSTYTTPEGTYRIVTGQLEEPVVTHAKTGLDVCVTLNNGARTPVSLDVGLVTATLVAPDNTTRLSEALRPQFGRPGCYQFERPYILTVPGQYRIELNGTINGTQVDMKGMLAGGAVADSGDIQFPSADASLAELRSENLRLRADVETLKAQVADMEGQGRDAPGLALPLLLVGLAGLAFAARRK